MSKLEGLDQNYGAVDLYSGGVDSTAAPLNRGRLLWAITTLELWLHNLPSWRQF